MTTNNMIDMTNIANSGTNTNITSMTGLTGVLESPTAIANSSGVDLLSFVYTASMVNGWVVIGNVTGSNPVFGPSGSDANINGLILAKGTGTIIVQSGSGGVPFALNSLGNLNNYNIALPSLSAARTLTLRDQSGTIAYTSDIPATTMVMKSGSGSGNYTTTSTSYTDIDATNLAYTVTIPVGTKVLINVSCTASQTALASAFVCLADSTTTLTEAGSTLGASTYDSVIGLTYIYTGDGNSHTFKLRFKSNSGANTANILNSTSTLTPFMTFMMVQSS